MPKEAGEEREEQVVCGQRAPVWNGCLYGSCRGQSDRQLRVMAPEVRTLHKHE